jgi:putative hydrolase
MPLPVNEDIAGRLEEVAQILAQQGANRFRVQAYRHAAAVVRALTEPVTEIFHRRGIAGLDELPGVGPSIARALRDLILHGRLAMLERLRGHHDPVALISTIPGISKARATQLHDQLGLESLEELEAAAHDGRLEMFGGFAGKRLAGIRDSLAHRLARIRPVPAPEDGSHRPPVAELLDVDAEYRREATAGKLPKIAPKRFNPLHEAWLPVLHTIRGARHYTALFSNTERAHDLFKTRDWVVLYYDGHDGESRATVITADFGSARGRRIVRGRENECEAYYREQAAP